MTQPDDDRRDAAPESADPAPPFDDFDVETESLPDGRRIHYYRWLAADPPEKPDV